ncbi:glycosyltransferase [Butyrivibrio sp. VCD2006]|uniref:glycosyltransferase n=1 Tax=Butyrivibrio sp. VCD2006 TaxID=1280664 RepID=UPI0004195EFD|nr:glycosyltransferase [Butyrivibrio sp. VCD2006]
MATYNGSMFIKDQINSILNQLSMEDEIIISDDNSSDDTVSIIKGINDPRLKLLSHNPTGYYTSNFENALKYASGEIIFLSDQDDIWCENKVMKCVEYLKSYDFVMTNAYVVDNDLRVKIESRNQYYNVRTGFMRNFIKSRYLGCCFAFKRSVLEYALPFPRNHDLAHHDSWISLVAEMNFKCVVLDERLVMYRRHNENTSTGGATSSKLSKTILIRLYLIMNLLSRKFERSLRI